MNEIRDALSRMVQAGRDVEVLRNAYVKAGLESDPLSDISNCIQDAIYHLIGEEKDRFTDSVTCLVMNAPYISNERRTEMLMSEFRKNYPDIPKPLTIEPDEIQKLHRKNGGYSFDSPEGG